jgi:hypothetical protein
MKMEKGAYLGISSCGVYSCIYVVTSEQAKLHLASKSQIGLACTRVVESQCQHMYAVIYCGSTLRTVPVRLAFFPREFIYIRSVNWGVHRAHIVLLFVLYATTKRKADTQRERASIPPPLVSPRPAPLVIGDIPTVWSTGAGLPGT